MKTHRSIRQLILAALLWPPLLGGVQAQDNLWVHGNQLLDFNTELDPNNQPYPTKVCNLPIGPNSWDYQGQVAQYSQNAQYDENGKLLFFVVDGAIYDHEGYLIADNDLRPGCVDCLPRGIQEISIVLVPGTCDRYYIISGRARRYTGQADLPCEWPSGSYEKSFLGYSLLDLSMGNVYHAGRKGRVWHEQDLLDLYDTEPAYYSNMGPQLYNNCLNEDNTDGSAIFRLASGNVPVHEFGSSSGGLNNIYHLVCDAATPASTSKLLFIRTAMEYLVATITPHGITGPQFLDWSDPDMQNNQDTPSTMAGGMAMAARGDGSFVLAATNNMGLSVTPFTDETIDLLHFQLAGTTVNLLDHRKVLSYTGTTPTGNIGRVRGVAFSPNGEYLYFAQPFVPYVGYFDLAEAALPVHDLGAELGLAPGTMASYGRGHIRLNHTADGAGQAIYFPSASGLGYLEGPDDPTSASWHSTLATTGTLVPPPASAMTQEDNASIVQYLMDVQNFRDQQIPSLAQPACCLVRMQQSLGNHTYMYDGINTPATAWTPQNNPLASGGGSLCPPSNPNTSTGTAVAYFTQDFVVQTGARLYVQGMEWRFAPNARLIVHKGAFVKFDNCVLRGGICGYQRWPGVIVEGTPTAAQGASAYPADQGRMVFDNSVLMDALTGVLVGGSTKSGGILEVSNSTFLNCRIGVDFFPYQNHLPNGNPTRNRSRFYKTTFTVDHNYIAPFDFKYHAQLWGVDGIDFWACDFSNRRTTEHNSLALGIGIHALDAHFRATGLCADPGPVPAGTCQNWTPTTFTGLDMGIRARTATAFRPFYVDQAHFEDNVCGVYAHSVPNFEVHNSTFLVGSTKATNLDNWPDEQHWITNGDLAHRGIYSYRSNGFLVDDNQLDAMPGATTAALEGIVTGYSYGYNDIVFRNHAQDLHAAYVGEGTCVDLNNRALVGLWYLCNTNDNNDNGIWSRRDDSPLAADYPDQSIRTNQGTRLRPADNTFGQTPGQLDIKNSNYANNALTYWWTLPQVPYWPEYVSVGVSRDNQDGTGNLIARDPKNCASRIAPLIPFPPNPEPAAQRAHLLNEAQARKAAYGNTRYLYDALIDGGSTDETVQEIQSAWPNEAWELRAMLLEKSPYLSNEVLMAVVEKNVLPVAMVAEICIANPEATQREGFMDWLENKAPINMPGYMLDNIRASWETKTYRTTLENTLAFEHSEMTQALAMLTASYQADTLVEQVDSIRAALQVLRTPAARYHEILTYLQQDNFDSAYAVMDRLPVEFRLRDKQVNEKDRTKQFIGIVQGYRTAGRTSAELDENELTALRNLRDDYYDRPAEWAQNILCFGYGDCRAPRTGGDDEGGLKRMGMPLHTGNEVEPALSAYPNPADAWTTLQYRLDGMPQEAWLVFRDITGREVARMPVGQGEGQQVWDTRQVVVKP